MTEFIYGAITGIVCTFTLVAINLDTYGSSFHAAEAACISLNSHVYSFDSDIATCENEATIKFTPWRKQK